jgi:formamidopyrimidine-DNA glycosylase
VRRFGTAVLLEGRAASDEYLATRVGIEPLSEELTPEALLRMAEGRAVPLKSFLLTQTGVAGIGNIYADEALFRAELHPLSPAGSMRIEHAEALVEGIVEALETGLEKGGSSMNDYVDALGETGSMQDEFLVHTREGQECPRCAGTIERIVVGGRSTYFCAKCQVRLRKRPKRRRKRASAA